MHNALMAVLAQTPKGRELELRLIALRHQVSVLRDNTRVGFAGRIGNTEHHWPDRR
jgi:hypothetical protein